MKVIFKPLSKEIEKEFILDCSSTSRLTLGRKDSNDVVLPFRNVSSFHAILECVDGILYVEDLNSTNGTFVNNSRISGRVTIGNNDRVMFASYEFLVEFKEEENETSSSSDIPAGGTVFLDASKIEEVRSAIENLENGDKLEEEKEQTQSKEVSKETVLYGVKGLMQNGRLILLDEKRKFLEEYQLEEFETSIGRDETNTISIDHPSISRLHCFVNKKEEGYYEVADNDSTNGVFVNGRKVKKTLLKNGDILKLGDKEFVFIAPGELFSPAFIKSKDSKSGLKFDKKKVYIGIGVFFLVLIIILALIPSEGGKRRRVSAISVKELKSEVKNSFKNEDWDNVVYLVENFKLKGFDKEYQKAKFEMKNREKFLQFADSLNSQDFVKAKSFIEQLDKDSVYYSRAKKLYDKKTEEYISTKLEEVDSLLDGNRVKDAYSLVENLYSEFPENEKVAQAKTDTEKKYNLFMKQTKARQRYYALRRNLKSKSLALEKEAESLYLQGKIVDAIAKLIDARQLYIAKNVKVPSKIDRLKENLGKVRDLYLSGKKEIMQGKTEDAADKFEQLFEISRKYLWNQDGKIENECKQLLKDYYQAKARSFYRANNYTRALDYAVKVLDIDSTNREMASLKRDILRKAKSLYNKGYIEQTQYKNCKAALFYFRQVIEILPSNDPVYKKAMKRIKECEK